MGAGLGIFGGGVRRFGGGGILDDEDGGGGVGCCTVTTIFGFGVFNGVGRVGAVVVDFGSYRWLWNLI